MQTQTHTTHTHTHTQPGAAPPFVQQPAIPPESSLAVSDKQHAPELLAESAAAVKARNAPADAWDGAIEEMSAEELERQWVADAEERERMELLDAEERERTELFEAEERERIELLKVIRAAHTACVRAHCFELGFGAHWCAPLRMCACRHVSNLV